MKRTLAVLLLGVAYAHAQLTISGPGSLNAASLSGTIAATQVTGTATTLANTPQASANVLTLPNGTVLNVTAGTNTLGTAAYTAATAYVGASGTIPALQVSFTATGAGATASTLDAFSRARSINAKTDFGAVGDNSADDTTKINNALAAGALSGKAVILASGTYKITSEINISSNGAILYGEGKGRTVLNQTGTNASGIKVTAAYNDIAIRDLSVTGVGSGTSTKYGIELSGSGGSVDGAHFLNVDVRGFSVGLYGDSVSNSSFQSCSFTRNVKQVYLFDNSNSDSFEGCSFTSDTDTNAVTGFEYSSGRGTTINGCDFGGPYMPTCVLFDGATTLALTGCNMEVYGGTAAINCTTAGTVLTLVNLHAKGFGSPATYVVQQAASAGVVIIGGSFPSFAGGQAQVKQISTIDTPLTFLSGGGTLKVESYNTGTLIDTWYANDFQTIAQSDGAAASAAPGLFKRQMTSGSVEVLKYSYRKADGTYAFADILAPAVDSTYAHTNVANTWTAAQTSVGPTKNKGNGLGFGFVAQSPAVSDSTWAEFGCYNYAQDEFYIAVGNGRNAAATLPRLYHDSANNRTSIGHNANTQPSGTKTLNVEGTLDVTGRTTLGAPANLKGYTVATLPAGTTGDVAYVTDALAPTFLGTVVGGGAITAPVFYNGSNWVAQ